MAGIRKRTWTDSKGNIRSCYEITYRINGKLCRKSGYKTKIEAQEDLPRVTKEYNSTIKVWELAKEYIEKHCVIQCKDSTIDLYRGYVQSKLKEIKYRRAKDITKLDIEKIVLDMKRNGAANKYINNILIFIQSIYNYGIARGLLVNNPVKSVKKLKKVKKPIRFLNENEIQLFLEIAKEKVAFKYYALFYTAIFTGMRRGELLGLEWSDVDFYHKKININKQIYKGILTSTKTESGTRIIDMSDGLIEVLKEHRRRLKVVYNPVFAMDNGRHIHAYNMVNRYYKPVLRELSERLEYENNVDSLTFHGLRHTYASMLLSNNVPVKYVQEQLGHASSKITLDTYNHVMPSIKDRAMEIMNKIATSEDCITEKNVSGTVD